MRINYFHLVKLTTYVLLALLSPLQALATDYFLAPELPLSVASITSSDAVNFSVLPGRSYCLETKTITGSVFASIQGTVPTDPNLDLTTSARGDASPPIISPRIPAFSRFARSCFIATGNPASVSSYRARSTFSFTSGTTASTTLLQVYDTTLTGGFNTSVTDFNFLELTNALTSFTSDSGVITGKIVAKNVITDAVQLSTTFTVNAGDRVDVNLHDAVGPNVFGVVTVTHDGPPGSLKGVVSQYRLVRLVPFDFEPVLQQPLLRASGLP